MERSRRPMGCAGELGDESPAAVQVIVVDDPASSLGTVETWGLSELGLPELEVREVRQFLLPHAASLLRRLAAHLLQLDRDVRSGETVRLGCDSVVRLVAGMSESGRAAQTLVLVDAPEMRRHCAGPCDHQLDVEPSGSSAEGRGQPVGLDSATARDPPDPSDMN